MSWCLLSNIEVSITSNFINLHAHDNIGQVASLNIITLYGYPYLCYLYLFSNLYYFFYYNTNFNQRYESGKVYKGIFLTVSIYSIFLSSKNGFRAEYYLKHSIRLRYALSAAWSTHE